MKQIIFPFVRKLFALFIMVICFGGSAHAENRLVIGTGDAIPPYFIAENNSGMEMEILQEALRISNYEVIPKYLPLARTFIEFENGILDGVTNVKEGTVKRGLLSDTVIRFHNCAVSLEKNNFPIILPLQYLTDKRVAAFQRASDLLGEEFGEMTKKNSKYREIANQMVQINLLFTGRTDFIVMDRNIFAYYRKKAEKEVESGHKPKMVDVKQMVIYHEIFPPTDYCFAFQKKSVRDAFNLGLKTIRDNGTYAGIVKKYADMMVVNEYETPEPQ